MDLKGRQIINIIGGYIPAEKVSLESILMYALYVMNGVAESDYVIVYVQTASNSENR